jgi:hypothetical protein
MSTGTLTTGPGIELEQKSVFTVLGIQFWDFAFDTPITDSLQVSAQLKDTAYPLLPAYRTGSGVYAFQGLPCLRSVEYPPPEPVAAPSPAPTFSFVITVADTLDRFVPTVFGVDLPLPYRGLFLSNDVPSPVDAAARAYLFSAPTRPVVVGMAAVRADLWDHEAQAPAAFAALRVQVDGSVWLGTADENGRVLVAFPYPLLQRLSLGSPPGSGQGTLTSMSWPITVDVQYEPGAQSLLLQSTPFVQWPWNVTPSLKSILENQSAAQVWLAAAGPPVAQWTGQLTYGEELVLRTTPNDSKAPSGYLSISRGTSP